MVIAPEDAKDRQFVAALARGLEVLKCFTAESPELGASDIARLTGIPQPTVWRLCYTLMQMGYLIAVPNRPTMRPGLPLLGLGQAALLAQPIGQLALPQMQAIAQRHEGAVSLGARDGLDMVYLQRCQGSAIVLADLRVGSRVPLGTSATGWAYIAGLSPEPRESLIAELAASLGNRWADLEPRLRAALAEFDRTGYVINLGSLHPRINSVAVPIVCDNGKDLYSLSSGGISQIFTPERLPKIAAELQALAHQLAPALSFYRAESEQAPSMD